VQNFETECFHWVDGATAVSSQEAAWISKVGITYPVAVIENGVDVDYFHPLDTPAGTRKLVFTGSMDWRPNQDACLFFVHEIMPILRKSVPDLEVYFVGRNPPPRLTSLSRAVGVHVTGSVDDVRPYIAEAAAVIVPLRIGGGSRLKILEAMAMKKAVISTTVGAEGLEVTDNKDILIADQPEEFADSIIRCLKDLGLRKSVAEAGHQLVHSKYRWEIIGEKYQRYLRSIVDGS
jgi:glycosyltransferase involved in cell wall biosynthesis